MFEMLGHFKELHNIVDYYTYIKGLEYLICGAFFCVFPMFYRFINKED